MVTKSDKIKILTSLRKDIKENKYPLSYIKDFSFYHQNPNFNCYAYALGLKTPNKYFNLRWDGLNIYNPGTISQFKIIIYDEKTLIESFLSDCDILGFDIINSTINDTISDNYFKVSIYLEENQDSFFRDFHFMRQNEDGTWSHMKSVGGIVTLVSDAELSKCNGNYNYLSTYALKKKK